MPGGDRTGPLGLGARTGRAAGLCNGNNQAGRGGFGQGRGAGGGRGRQGGARGGGRAGWCRWGADGGPTTMETSERSVLKRRKEALKRQLEAVRNRLRQMGTTDDIEP